MSEEKTAGAPPTPLRRLDVLYSALLFSLALFVSIPIAVFSQNADELDLSLFEFLPTALVLFLLSTLLLSWITGFLSRRGRVLPYVALSALFYLIWFQANVFQWDYGQLEDGDWYGNWQYGVVDGLFWAAGLFLAVRFSGRLVAPLRRLNPWALVFSVAMLALTLARVPYGRMDYKLDDGPKYELSGERNVIMLLLDESQSNVYQELIEEDREFKDALEGFTFFTDSVSNTKSTSLSVPMILTGKFFDNSEPFDAFLKENLVHHSIPALMVSQGYSSDLYPLSLYFSDSYINPSFVSNFKRKSGYDLTPSAKVYDLALFVSLPHVAKKLVYDDREWLLQSDRKAIRAWNARLRWRGWFPKKSAKSAPKKPSVAARGNREEGAQPKKRRAGDGDTYFFRGFMTSAATTSTQPKFKFYHLTGSHTPFNLTRTGEYVPKSTYHEKARYKIGLVKGFLRRLKEIGAYDDSLIIILGDHGSGRSDETKTFRDPATGAVERLTYDTSRANALLMIKDFGARGQLRLDDGPIQSLDLLPLLKARLEKDRPVRSFVAELPRERVRRYFSYHWKSFRPYIKVFQEMLVVGPPRHRSAFIEVHNHPPAFDRRKCLFNHTENLRYLGDFAKDRKLAKTGAKSWELVLTQQLKRGAIGLVSLRSDGEGESEVILSANGRETRFPIRKGTNLLEFEQADRPAGTREFTLRVFAPQGRLGYDLALENIHLFEVLRGVGEE